MNIVKPGFVIESSVDASRILENLERYGRTAYKSEEKITSTSSADFIRGIIKSGHESVIEHEYLTVRFICDRGVTHEIVRHRLVSYTQESTRYCNYSKKGITYIDPGDFVLEQDDLSLLKVIEDHYNKKIKQGRTPQQARYFLPNGLKTEIVCTANLREWRHILKLRTAKTAHPQMREIMTPLLRRLKELLPIVFDDIDPDAAKMVVNR